MKNNNKGYTLIELVVVLAILAIFIVFGITGLNYIFGTAVNSCAHDVKSAIGAVRINTMGKYESTLHIYQGADGYYKQEYYKVVDPTGAVSTTWENDEPYKIGKSYLTLTYQTKGGTSGTVDADGIWIGFDRGSGKERDVDASSSLPPGKAGAADLFTEIAVSGVKTVKVTIVPATGKIYIE